MGRPKAVGKLHYLGRVRFVPGLHSETLGRFLAQFSAASQDEKLALLEQLLAGKVDLGDGDILSFGEDAETGEFLEDLLSDL